MSLQIISKNKNIQKKVFLVFPGWGFDKRIFSVLEDHYQCYYPCAEEDQSTEFLIRSLIVRHNFTHFSILGWSMGAYEAVRMGRIFKNMVTNMYLVSARYHYPESELDGVRKGIEKNKDGFLRFFYKRCFAKNEIDFYRLFKTGLEKEYLRDFQTENLLDGIVVLDREYLDISGFPSGRTVIIHGRNDVIAPAREIDCIVRQGNIKKCIYMDKVGHIPFLHEDFCRYVE